MRIQINGEEREFERELPLAELIQHLSLPAERIAVELNRHVISRKQWPATLVKDGDRLEIVHFVGGGSV
jgi:thiamine biosynthesis protein ThiS